MIPGPEVVGDGSTPVNLSILALDEAGAPITGLTGKITPTDGTVQDIREIRPQGATGAGRIVVRGLHYDDVLHRKEGRWRIARRKHAVLWQYELPLIEQRLP